DIPGIIEGAHGGSGLGLDFLRHVQRTRVLLHVVDVSGFSSSDPARDLALVREEVRLWDPTLLTRPQLVAASKRDALAEKDPLPAFREAARGIGLEVIPISSVTGEGLPELKRALARLVALSRGSQELEAPA
ncbi:MAG TPA: GTPase ObgE, partial [Vicinamibacteria bacterium]|nr:GTPase ObgE [Vicinamibacteria bacterium]